MPKKEWDLMTRKKVTLTYARRYQKTQLRLFEKKIALKENRDAIFNVLPHAFLRRGGGLRRGRPPLYPLPLCGRGNDYMFFEQPLT